MGSMAHCGWGTGGELSSPGFSFPSHTSQTTGPCLHSWNGYPVKNVPPRLSWLAQLSSAETCCESESCFQKGVTLIPLLSSSGTIRDGARVVAVIANMYWGFLWDKHCARCWGYKDSISVLVRGRVRILIQCIIMWHFCGYRFWMQRQIFLFLANWEGLIRMIAYFRIISLITWHIIGNSINADLN